MNGKQFLTGMGIGMVAGGTIGMLISPKRKCASKNSVSRAFRGMGDVIESVGDVFNR